MILDHYQSKNSYKFILKAASKLVLFSMNNVYLSVCRCRFMGLGNTVNSLRKTWKRNVDKWYALEFHLRFFNFCTSEVNVWLAVAEENYHAIC